MPWCPKCGAEYREGIARCHDCGVELVDALAEEVKPVLLSYDAGGREAYFTTVPDDVQADLATFLL